MAGGGWSRIAESVNKPVLACYGNRRLGRQIATTLRPRAPINCSHRVPHTPLCVHHPFSDASTRVSRVSARRLRPFLSNINTSHVGTYIGCKTLVLTAARARTVHRRAIACRNLYVCRRSTHVIAASTSRQCNTTALCGDSRIFTIPTCSIRPCV